MILACALFDAAFGVFHLFFWRLFDWPRQLRALSPLNRAVVQILNLCLTFVFFAAAGIGFRFGAGLAAEPIGRALLAAMALFWTLRALLQALFFGLRHPASLAFLLIFLAGAALHAWPLL